MRIIGFLLITLPIAVVVVSFAVSNRGSVALEFWPLPGDMLLPVYLMVLAPLVVGFLIGAFIAWLSAGKHRELARMRKNKLDELGRRLITLQEKQATIDEAARRETEQARVATAAKSASDAAQLERSTERRALPAAEAS